jgi:hypothetical protein
LPFFQDKSTRRLLLWVLGFTLIFGAFEGFFGRVLHSGDGISYLDVVRAIHGGDWRAAFSPYWGLGYPLLLSAWLPIFPSGPGWEWIGILLLNLLILTTSFFCFYRMATQAFALVQGEGYMAGSRSEQFLLMAAFPIFLSTEVSIDNVSRVSPDMLVACLVYACVGCLLAMLRQPNGQSSRRPAAVLGLLLGFGYMVKGIFLPLSLAFLAIEAVILWRRRGAVKLLAFTLLSMAIFAIPYAAGLSWAYGRPTFGEVGSLNYAWYVNGLQMDAFWEGGPPEFGKPLHPPMQVADHPAVFLFDGPHAVTFTPWFNPPYYYQGYRHFFQLSRQVAEVKRDLGDLFNILFRRLVLYVLLLGILLRWLKSSRRYNLVPVLLNIWPLVAAAILGITIYVLVYLQPRHIASFIGLVLFSLCLALVGSDAGAFERAFPPKLRAAILVLLLGVWIVNVAAQRGNPDILPFDHLASQQTFLNSSQWKAGRYLLQTGLHPGDKVAWIAGYAEITQCTWAYMDHLRIIGEIGGEPLEPPHDDLAEFWQLTSAERRQKLEIFHQAGARLVLALDTPKNTDLTGWENIPGTGYLIYRF